MKKTIFTLLLAGIAQFVMAQFEGKFTMTIVNEKRPEPMVINYTMKGDKIMTEMNMRGNTMKSIIDNTAGTTTMLMDRGGNKTAMRTKFAGMPALAEEKKEEPKVTKTTETKVIEGQDCIKYIIETAENTTELWITSINTFGFKDAIEAFSRTNQGRMFARNKPVGYEKIEGTPLQYIIKNKTTNETTTVTFGNITKTQIADAVFDLTGYQIMEMPSMDMMNRPGMPGEPAKEKH
jgi:hypothetical protein